MSVLGQASLATGNKFMLSAQICRLLEAWSTEMLTPKFAG